MVNNLLAKFLKMLIGSSALLTMTSHNKDFSSYYEEFWSWDGPSALLLPEARAWSLNAGRPQGEG